MKKENLKTIVLPKFDEKDIENLTLVGPIEFLSEKENAYLLDNLKQRLKEASNPDNWLHLEECISSIKGKLSL